MHRCASRHPSAQITLLGSRIGAKVVKATLMSAAAGRLTPEILSEALQSSSTIRSHIQREAVKILVVRISMLSPQQLQWLLRLIGDYLGGLSLTGAISSLTKRSLLYQITNFGVRGCAASAITTAAVQVGLTTCTLVTTNAVFWKKGDHKMSMRQYRYELLTSFYTGVGSVAGSAAGAAVGSMAMPGVGTALGSVLGSVGVGYVPGSLRNEKGPDDRRRQQASALQQYTPLRMQDTCEGAVLMYNEELAEVPAAASTVDTAGASTSRTSGVSSSLDPAKLPQSASMDVESVGSDIEGGAEAEEVVWLDFVGSESPSPTTVAPAPTIGVGERKEGPAAYHTASSEPQSASVWERVREEEKQQPCAAAVRRLLRFISPSKLLSSPTRKEMDGHNELAVLSASSSDADIEDTDVGATVRAPG
ncbi:hypothetical protein ABL78_2138 [Leptomonas seymouri]|uniref:Uncharacterized protein n=1 Tax=Leptomonas seymouri TaxID=5684 RepID=A0A0N0P7G2_LEPSE|nr:hypothetical protein ABL78_2138 [Leptomonas seymouri]|eukprot:KPI88759.1 hypothetical protein ABL78_2138 [Leptomonas seymouri]